MGDVHFLPTMFLRIPLVERRRGQSVQLGLVPSSLLDSLLGEITKLRYENEWLLRCYTVVEGRIL